MVKKFSEFLNEQYEVSEKVEGLKLVKKMTTEEFMDSLGEGTDNGTIDNRYIYRLVDYQPKPDKWVYDMSEPYEVFKPVYVQHTGWSRRTGKYSFYKKENFPMTDQDIDWKGKTYTKPMFMSPFIIFPSNYREIKDYFLKRGDYYMRYGKITQKTENVVTGSHIGFSALSVSSLINSMDTLDLENGLDLNILLDKDNNEEKLGVKLGKFARNYIGYDFAEVYVYEVTDSEAAVNAIHDESEKTNTLGKFIDVKEL